MFRMIKTTVCRHLWNAMQNEVTCKSLYNLETAEGPNLQNLVKKLQSYQTAHHLTAEQSQMQLKIGRN